MFNLLRFADTPSSLVVPAAIIFLVIGKLVLAIIYLFNKLTTERDKVVSLTREISDIKEKAARDLAIEKEKKVKDLEDLKKLMIRGNKDTERRT